MYDTFKRAAGSHWKDAAGLAGEASTKGATGSISANRTNSRDHWRSQWHTRVNQLVAALAVTMAACCASSVVGQDDVDMINSLHNKSMVRKISDVSEKLELTTNTSRILTLDKNIPRVQVNNPELLVVTPLSATQVQVSAKKAGVTQVNLWDEEGNIHTVDVLIYGDAKELEVALATQFPHSTIKVYRYSESLVLKGFVDRPDHVSQIVALAEDYAPKIINNISVGGVQQVLLKVRVFEVSRTKLRQLGTDWAYLGGSGDFAISSVSGLINDFDTGTGVVDIVNDTFSFGIVDGNSNFFGVLDALQENRVAKILAEPNIVAVSGRPAQFAVGGEFPILVPQSLGTTSIEYKKYGTQVDFLPIVLGNGNIRLEVRPRISERDPTLSVELAGTFVPALTVREVDTAVEMKAGQTFAIAGLVQERTESINRGFPFLADIPILGVPFRKTRDSVNEIELLIMVTPEFVEAIDPCALPCGGPGYCTTQPTDCGLYCGGHVEVPTATNPTSGMTACGECGPCGPTCDYCGGYPNHPYGCNAGACDADGASGAPCNCGPGASTMPPAPVQEEMILPGGTGYDDSYMPMPEQPIKPISNSVMRKQKPGQVKRKASAAPTTEPSLDKPIQLQPGSAIPPMGGGENSGLGTPTTSPRPYSPQRTPSFVRNSSSPNNPYGSEVESVPLDIAPGLIGPVGYDAQ